MGLHRLPLSEEPVGDAALIEHLDGPRVHAAGPRSVVVVVGPPFHHRDVDPGEGELACQHQPGRAPARDHHFMLGHAHFAPKF